MTEKWDIMISYHQASGMKYMKKIKTALLQKGYSVWVDEDQVYGNLGERMSEGVARSELILLLLSKGYEDSKNCQKEYNLTSAQHKKAICVMVEEGYKPPSDHILNLIKGSNMYYPLYKDDDDAYFHNLLKDISKQLTKEGKTDNLPSSSSNGDSVGSKPQSSTDKNAEELTPASSPSKDKGDAQRPHSDKGTPKKNSEEDEFLDKCMIAYLTEKWFMENTEQVLDKKQDFAFQLGLKDEKVGKIFSTNFRTQNPILECVCSKAFETKCSKEQLLSSVNEAFENSGFSHEITEEEISDGPFKKIETGGSTIDLSTVRKRNKFFRDMAIWCGDENRYVLHFLVPYMIVRNCFLNQPNSVEDRTVATLKQWTVKTKKENITWGRFRALLNFLGREDVVHELVGEK
ncbi:uncharacterized protein LOC130628821 [Hydractinia symbiolongicarpus]|uniref:uncharacterized protein LOC130628821 n=1 Tax=Hydractinia symbiolongicarpus TaxID=13093 RepID=UPI002549F025|nr:uncharacterized protein LOC130628821 [Hydractinia symbiolongicarpus]